MNYENLAKSILNYVGEEGNVEHVTHCATRLRFNLKDVSKVNQEKLKQTKGVMGVVNSNGQFQIIIGSDVANVYKKLMELGSFQKSNDGNTEKSKKGISSIFEIISGIFTPILQPLAAAGMLKAVLVIATTFGWLTKDSQTYYIFNFVSDSLFFFFPVILGYTSAVKFKANPYMGMLIGGMLIHPSFSALVSAGESVTLLGLPIKLINYSSTVVPIILIVWIMSYVEAFADKISPKPIKFFSKPLITMLVMTPIAFSALGPIGSFLGDGLSKVIDTINGVAPWSIPMIVGATSPLLVMVGMHYALIPMGINGIALNGYENIVGPGMLVSNIAQGASTLAVAAKTKNKDLKQLAGSAGLTAVLGITEPAMYGVTMRLKKPLISIMISGGIAGAYAGFTGVVRYASGSPGIASLPIFMGDNPMNIIHTIIALAIAFVSAFILTWIIGFEEPSNEEQTVEVDEVVEEEVEEKSIEPLNKKIIIASPANGKVVQLKDVNDETFAGEFMGKGIAINPSEGKIVSPVNGKVQMIFNTKHAIGLTSEDGTEILIHIGIDTVQLNGKYFKSYVESGDEINVGDTLVEFDMDAIKKEGYDLITPVIVTNTNDYLEVLPKEIEEVNAGNTVLTII
ncbi:beta-glucoside-specific PTS transporter subunit IIABC [Clostridium sp.]|uniref:beta-glucoside-specific PTS transporter subunit IIABC n=1 Tax=Clostridium sp. TaxID=1506 RepID=UPI003F381323